MANENSTQFEAAYVNPSKTELKPHELNGRVRSIFADVTVSSEKAVGEQIFMCKLPANSVIKSARVNVGAGSATAGTLVLGWNAGERYEAADNNGLLTAVDPTAAGTSAADAFTGNPGLMPKRFQEEVDIILEATVLTVGMTGDVLKLELEYIVD